MTRRATNMFVCNIRFIRLGHAYKRRQATPSGVRSALGAVWGHNTSAAQGWRACRPPDGHAHRRAAKGKATLCKQIAGASAVPLGYKARVCHIIVCCRRDPT